MKLNLIFVAQFTILFCMLYSDANASKSYGYIFMRSNPSAFKIDNKKALILCSEYAGEFNYETCQLSLIRTIGKAGKEGNGYVKQGVSSEPNYIVKNINLSDPKKFTLAIENKDSKTNVITFSTEFEFESDLVSLFSVKNLYYAAWMKNTKIEMVSFDLTTTSLTLKTSSSNQIRDFLHCIGLADTFICAYNIQYYKQCYLEIFDENMASLKDFQIDYGCSGLSIKGMKLGPIAEYPNSLFFCFIDSGDIKCVSGLINGLDFKEIAPARNMINDCSEQSSDFAIAPFQNDYAVICTKSSKIKIQRLKIDMTLIGNTIELSKSETVIMPSIVTFSLDVVGIFFGTNTAKIGYHILMVPKCLNGLTMTISRNEKVPLDFTFSIDPNYIYDGLLVQINNPYSPTSTFYSKSGEYIPTKGYPLDDLSYSSSDLGTFTFDFVLKTSEDLASNPCQVSFIVSCYQSCFSCLVITATNTNHQCKSCLPNYHGTKDDYDAKIPNCYEDSTKEADGYILDNFNGIDLFVKCDVSCKTCSIAANRCMECESTYYPIDSQTPPTECYKTLPKYYLDVDKWKQCYKSCKTCNGYGSEAKHNCIDCLNERKKEYYKVEGQLDDFCGLQKDFLNYYIAADGKLKKCEDKCATCSKGLDTSGSNCISCINDHYLSTFDTNCYAKNDPALPPSTYFNEKQGQFMKCSANCEECHYNFIVDSSCDKCIANKYMYNGSCSDSCKSHLFSYDNPAGFECLDNCPYYLKAQWIRPKKCIKCPVFLYSNECETIQPEDTYISDTTYNILSKCYDACKKCGELGTETDTKCTQCKDDYYIYKKESQCEQKDKLIDYYYADATEAKFLPCYEGCKTCDGPEEPSSYNHHCTSCNTDGGYVPHPTVSTNCIKECTVYWYIDTIDDRYICTSVCPPDYQYLFGKTRQCAPSCEDFLNVNKLLFQYDGGCHENCPANAIGTQSDRVCHYLSDVDELISALTLIIIENERGLAPVNYMLFEGNLQFQLCSTEPTLQSSCNEEAMKYGSSTLDLSDCFETLRKVFNIFASDHLYTAIFDKKTDYLTPQVEFLIYDANGNKLDTKFCKNAEIVLNKQLDKSDQFKRANEIFEEYGYNILYKSDPFYTDICLPITSENYTDVLLNDRFDYYYSNFSVCEEGCTLLDFNLSQYRANCSCTFNGEMDLDINKTFSVEQGSKKGRDSTLKFFTCFMNAFSLHIFDSNIGNFISIGLMISQVLLMAYFFLFGDKNLFSYMRTQMILLNPPKKLCTVIQSVNKNDDINESDLNAESIIDNDGHIGKPSVLFAKDFDPNVRYFVDDEREEANDVRKMLEKMNRQTQNQSLSQISKGEVSQSESNKDKGKDKEKSIHNEKSIESNKNDISKTLELSHSSKNSHKSKGRNKYPVKNHFKFGGEASSSRQTLQHSLSIKQAPLFDSKILSVNKQFKENSVYIYNAKEKVPEKFRKYSDLTLMSLYWLVLKKQHRIFNFIFANSIFDLRALKASLFLVSFSFDMLFSTLFCSNDLIQSLFLQRKFYSTVYIGLVALISCIIGYIIMKVITWALESKSAFEKVIKKKENGQEYIAELKTVTHQYRRKLWVYFILMIILLVFIWYITTVFCATFVNTQSSWLTMIIVSFGLSMLFPFIYYFLISAMLSCSIHSRCSCIFNCSKCWLRL